MYNNNEKTKFQKETEELNVRLNEMREYVQEAIKKSISALINRDEAMAKQVIADDEIIDSQEKDIEQRSLRLLLMEHPVASDFLRISATLKLITDLERIADQAADISDISLKFNGKEFIKKPHHIQKMSFLAIDMVKDGIAAYINGDVDTAAKLKSRDDEVDSLFDVVKNELVELIKANPENAEQALLFMMIAKYLERIGDHAVNIGEWAIYSVTGKRN